MTYASTIIPTLALIGVAAVVVSMRLARARRSVGEVAQAMGLKAISGSPRQWEGLVRGRNVRLGWADVPEEMSVGSDMRALAAFNSAMGGAQAVIGGEPWRVFAASRSSTGGAQRQLAIEVSCQNPCLVDFVRSGSGLASEANLECLPSNVAVELLDLHPKKLEVFEISGRSVSFRMDDRMQLYMSAKWLQNWLDRCLDLANIVDQVGPGGQRRS